ncbi:uncharacterized protein LOC118514712 [Anopheles stephensi]|uniref:uncharacterized protein LOC118514712 n=1 Tax=Anopheles stephensi TaxID=30069 RepID=UPI001658984B|nr:uncharacterized protein LOC118514712 [Anopheles stephensi]
MRTKIGLQIYVFTASSTRNQRPMAARIDRNPMAEHCIVEVSSGLIKGSITRLPGDAAAPCYSFKGIPYAIPPVGPLRFRTPQPLPRHPDGLLDCTTERAVSLASSYLPPDAQLASEDCLFLNVYSPINPHDGGRTAGVPVMVWLHGGAFCTGSGDSSIYHPEWLVAQGVLVVTVNYRLGPAGFLCLPSLGIYGNMGLKDQRLALEWVRTNVRSFGGDAGNVTLFGESAGAVSAHLHSLSERSNGLFQRVICQSGVATSSITFQKHPERKARRLAEYFGCPAGASDATVLETLANVDPALLAKSQKEALTPYERTLDSVYPFRPVVESPESGDAIIAEDVFELLRRSADGSGKPMMVGVNSEEALYKINTFRQHLQRYAEDICRFVPELLNVPDDERSLVAQRIIDFNCGPAGVCLEKELELSRIFTDTLYLIPAVQAAELQLAHRQGDIFFYHFGAETELNKFRQLWKVPAEYRGASHADDVCYLFSSSYLGTDSVPKDSPAWRLRKAMCCLWTSFAKTGVPRTEDADWTALRQPNGESFRLSALKIGHDMRMVETLHADRVAFWSELFNKYSKSSTVSGFWKTVVRSVLCKLPTKMVIRKLYVPPTVVKTIPLLPPPAVDPNFLPPATAYQPPAEDLPIIVEPESTSNGGPLVFADDVELELEPGKIVGRRKVLPNGSEYFSYQGIPYAEPPVGALRFKSPVPVEKFAEQPLQCGAEKGICLGVMSLPAGTTGGEDCLYLNVYTTSGPSETLGMLKPVMVWIHGGGFYTGSANSDFYGPEFLLQHGVVLVTLNYRLGPLGFLALPSVGIHGNQGLKDQQLALRWVHDNITRFGGDPTNVTLFGESAGSASVNWHYLCPQSRQYFHKAICQSGSVLCPWGLQYQPEGKARKLAAVLGYAGEDDAGVLETLLNASAEDLVSNSAKAFEETEKSIYFVSPFIPSIEDPSSEDAIITQRGEELLKQPNVTTIPLIHGLTSAEGLVFYGPLQQLFDELAGNLAMMLPLDFGVPRDFAPAVVEELRQFYFQDKPIERDELPRLLNLVGDVGFNFPVCAAAELHSRYQQEAPLYFYRFSYENELNQMRKQFNVPDGTPGAAHADELPYLFSGSEFTVQVEPGSGPDLARTLLCRLWTNFAKFGNPTPDGDDVGFQWEPLPPTAAGEPFVLRALDLNEQVEVVENPLHERIQFWKSLAERFNPNLLP